MQRRALLILTAILSLLCVAGALTPTSTWIDIFNHPARTARNGHIAATTIQAASVWRVSLSFAATLVPLLTWLLVRSTSRDHSLPRPKRSTAFLFIAATAILIGVVIRAPRLLESLWYDEIATLLDYIQHGPGPIMANYFSQANHVGFDVLAWCSIELLGLDEPALRLPALAASILTIPVLALLATEVSSLFPSRFGRGVRGEGQARTDLRGPHPGPLPEGEGDRSWRPAAGAVLAALLPVLVLEGVEARGYSLMIFFSAVASLCLIRALRNQGPAWWFGWSLALALGTWCHLVTAMVGVGHVVWLAIESALARRFDRRVWIPIIVATSLSALLTLTLYSPALPDMLARRSEFSRVEGNEPTILSAEGLRALMQLGGAWSWWALPGLALFAFGLAVGVKSPSSRRPLGLMLAGLPVAILLVLALGSWTYARFLLFALPGVVTAMTIAIDHAARRSRLLAAALLALVVGSSLADLFTRPPKQPIHDAVKAVASRRERDDQVAVVGLLDNVVAYYALEHEITLIDTGPLGVHLKEALERARPRFVILLYPQSVPADRFELLRTRGFTNPPTTFHGWVDWTNGDVLVFERS